MDIQAKVRVVADVRLAGVQAHPHSQLDAVGPVVLRKRPLCRHRRVGGAGCILEHDEELVPAVVDDMTFACLDALAQEPTVIAEQSRVLVPEALQQLRRSFDVGKEESDGAMG
jgi:hypothetical protein